MGERPRQSVTHKSGLHFRTFGKVKEKPRIKYFMLTYLDTNFSVLLFSLTGPSINEDIINIHFSCYILFRAKPLVDTLSPFMGSFSKMLQALVGLFESLYSNTEHIGPLLATIQMREK